MFYLYTILIPILIAVLSFYLEGKPNTKREVVNFLFNLFKTYVIYILLIYF